MLEIFSSKILFGIPTKSETNTKDLLSNGHSLGLWFLGSLLSKTLPIIIPGNYSSIRGIF